MDLLPPHQVGGFFLNPDANWNFRNMTNPDTVLLKAAKAQIANRDMKHYAPYYENKTKMKDWGPDYIKPSSFVPLFNFRNMANQDQNKLSNAQNSYQNQIMGTISSLNQALQSGDSAKEEYLLSNPTTRDLLAAAKDRFKYSFDRVPGKIEEFNILQKKSTTYSYDPSTRGYVNDLTAEPLGSPIDPNKFLFKPITVTLSSTGQPVVQMASAVVGAAPHAPNLGVPTAPPLESGVLIAPPFDSGVPLAPGPPSFNNQKSSMASVFADLLRNPTLNKSSINNHKSSTANNPMDNILAEILSKPTLKKVTQLEKSKEPLINGLPPNLGQLAAEQMKKLKKPTKLELTPEELSELNHAADIKAAHTAQLVAERNKDEAELKRLKNELGEVIKQSHIKPSREITETMEKISNEIKQYTNEIEMRRKVRAAEAKKFISHKDQSKQQLKNSLAEVRERLNKLKQREEDTFNAFTVPLPPLPPLAAQGAAQPLGSNAEEALPEVSHPTAPTIEQLIPNKPFEPSLENEPKDKQIKLTEKRVRHAGEPFALGKKGDVVGELRNRAILFNQFQPQSKAKERRALEPLLNEYARLHGMQQIGPVDTNTDYLEFLGLIRTMIAEELITGSKDDELNIDRIFGVSGKGLKRKRKRVVGPGRSVRSIIDSIGHPTNYQRLTDRLRLITGEIMAGNDSKKLKTELSKILNLLVSKGFMPAKMSKAFTKKLIL